MAGGRTYKTRGIVLRKTKLADKDLIVTVLAESGEKLKAVAKGARKPGGSLAGRLELFSACDLMLAKGKSLDVVTEARLLADSRSGAALGIEQAACASVIAELAGQIAQEGLEQPRLFDMTAAAFAELGQAAPETALLLTAADLFKTLALAGFRPVLGNCVSCGAPLDLEAAGSVPLSVSEGGTFCPSCARPSDSIFVESGLIRWVAVLIASRFADIRCMNADVGTSFELLQLVRQWSRSHVGRDLKSLDFLFTSGLY